MLGPTLFAIPLEEFFFFVIQTYLTSTIYHLLSRPVLHALLLPRTPTLAASASRRAALGSATLLATFFLACSVLVAGAGRASYLALIIAWTTPFLALLWAVASSHILALPWTAMALPVALPTVYLWVCDSYALRRGTWVIESGTKLGWAVCGLEVEEALFFLLTNVLVVWGLVACDYCLAVHDVSAGWSPGVQEALSSKGRGADARWALVQTIWQPYAELPFARLQDLHAATECLREKSKSFFLASALFEGGLQLDLLSLSVIFSLFDLFGAPR